MTDRSNIAPISPERPTPLRRTWLRNRWEELTFVHWPYPPEIVQALLPDGLTVDTHDGWAYVSLIPFRMSDAAPRFVPSVPWISRFLETNVRTYVIDSAGNRAIWFFSLEANRLAIVAFAKGLLGFPYVWSEMSLEIQGDTRRYTTRRRRWPREPGSTTDVTIEVGSTIDEPDGLDHFLTARWGTVASSPLSGRRLQHHPVDHEPWTLHEAELIDYRDESIVAAGLPTPSGTPRVRFAEPVRATFAIPDAV